MYKPPARQGNQNYDFDNLGLPQSFTDLCNKLTDEYRKLNKILYIKTKYQWETNSQIFRFNSTANRNKVIIAFKRKGKYRNDEDELVKVVTKSASNPSLNNFTKPNISIEKASFDYKMSFDDLLDYVYSKITLKGNEIPESINYDCLLNPASDYKTDDALVAFSIRDYEVLNENELMLELDGEDGAWDYKVESKRVTAFTLITKLKGMLLVFSPDGDYKVVGSRLRKELKFI
jgi:hypothetical protein